jgi:hypothetical protein
MIMYPQNHRAPLAVAIVALFAATTLTPASGAEAASDPFYTFRFGGPGQPTWTILKLEVTQPETTPTVAYGAAQPRCPMVWGTYFMTGTPGDTRSYNGLMFNWNAGRTGAHVRYDTPVLRGSPPAETIVNDGAESCAWWNPTVVYGEMPLGIVYMVQYFAGVPFESTSTVSFSAPGVTLLGVSSGSSSFYINETEFGGTGAVAYAPPFCGAPTEVANCAPMHMNPGGLAGASVALDRWAQFRFRHRPLYFLADQGTYSISNATLTLPTGEIRYAHANNEAGPFTLDGQGIMDFNLTGPPGWYK